MLSSAVEMETVLYKDFCNFLCVRVKPCYMMQCCTRATCIRYSSVIIKCAGV